MAPTESLDRSDAWADLLTVLAACFRAPDAALVDAVQTGALPAVLAETLEVLDLDPAAGAEPPRVDSLGALTESYLALFDALETPHAPLAESPYKPWYGDRRGLMEGPSAAEMNARYDAIAADRPAGYPADHAALLLEYGSLLLEVDAPAFGAFQATHYDWFPALRQATAGAAADAAFHRWAVHLLDDVTATLRARLGDDPVDADAARAMVDGIADATPADQPQDTQRERGPEVSP
jgi:TorA maturation chaperone TorD